MRPSTIVSVFVVSVLVSRPCPSQTPPEGWRWHVDVPSAGGAKPSIDEMVPGMHITTGPAVSIIAPGDPATGRFMLDAEIVMFPNSADRGHGILFGSRAGAPSDSWLAFMVAGDGRFTVVQRSGDKQTPLVAWTSHDAVVRKGAEPVTNRLRVSVERDSLRFTANGTRVGAIARGTLQTDGQFGLRVEEGVNLHVTNVDVARRLLKR